MASRDYPRLLIEQFGEELLATGDLDPIYLALHRLLEGRVVPWQTVHRWLVAYWCLYHAGAACYIAERSGEEFWAELYAAADNGKPNPLGERWPRGHERRHFRGDQGRLAVRALAEAYPTPEALIQFVSLEMEGGKYTQVAERVRQHRGFGPWMAFKVADMLERVLHVPVDVSQAEVFMFDDPTKAALMVYRQKQKMAPDATIPNPTEAICKVVTYLNKRFSKHKAPPGYDRPFGLCEAETVLCKFKSHLNGHYPLLNDITEIRGGLAPWCKVSKLAGMFLAVSPTGERL